MADPRFFSVSGPFTVAALAEIAGAALAATADGDRKIEDIAPLGDAGERDISFLDNKRYLQAFEGTRAGACIAAPDMANRAPANVSLLLSETPYLAFARVARTFYPVPPVEPGISPRATVHESATIAEGCRIDTGAVIGADCRIGARTHVCPNAAVGDAVVIGEDCVIGVGATVSHSLIGDRVTIYPGARIGQDGFGFASSPEGHMRIPQVGRVVIHDDVEVGANTTIDRGSAADTVIGAGCMIDNLVQIAHNVQLGRGCVIVAQVGLSGSTTLGDFVVFGGQSATAGHLTIGGGAQIAARSGVTHNLEGGQAYGGAPAIPIREWRRQMAAIARLGKVRD